MSYANGPSSPLCIAMTKFAQYDSNGVVKMIRHPDRLMVLRMKSSYADVVSTIFFIFLDESVL